MLSQADNEMITGTNRGTPMGELFRRFWLPVALSSELPGPDSLPLRVRIMGEDLIAFRDTDGRVGLVDAYCPHRGAPMFFGRNEENGLRCVYHGWKFDVDGVCTDLPNAPEGETFRQKIQIKRYPCEDVGDVIWAYMGPANRKPPLPDFEWMKLPKSHRYMTKFRMECNWLQAQEGDSDPSHGRFLHSTLAQKTEADSGSVRGRHEGNYGLAGPIDENEPFPRVVGNRRKSALRQHPSITGEVLEDEGAATLSIYVKDTDDGQKNATVRVGWYFPIFTTPGIVVRPTHYGCNMRVPIDDANMWFFRLRWSWEPISEDDINEYKNGGYTHPELIPGTWQTVLNVHNDYGVDRVAQRDFSYTGIKTFPMQDIAMMENQWGPIADRTQEHLTSLDFAIIYRRRRLLKMAKALLAGVEPTEPWATESFHLHGASATAATADEAIAQVKALATRPLLPEKLPQPVTVMTS